MKVLKGCDGKGRVVGGLGATFDFMPKAYRPCPQFEKAGGVYQKQSKAPWESNEEIGFNSQSRERAFRFKDFTLNIEQDPGGYVTSADGTGRVAWGSSYCLSEYLSRNYQSVITHFPADDDGASTQQPLQGLRVVELGAGLGMCSIACCKLGAQEVVATDGSQGTLELLERNANANLSPSERAVLSVQRLEWSTEEAQPANPEFGGPFDVVMLADVAYEANKNAWPALVATIKRLTDPALGSGEESHSASSCSPIVLWAHAARDDESRFESDRFQRELLGPLRKLFSVTQVDAAKLHPAYANGSNLRVFVMRRR